MRQTIRVKTWLISKIITPSSVSGGLRSLLLSLQGIIINYDSGIGSIFQKIYIIERKKIKEREIDKIA